MYAGASSLLSAPAMKGHITNAAELQALSLFRPDNRLWRFFLMCPSLVQCQSVTFEILSQVSISISTARPITNHTLIFSVSFRTFLFSSNFVTEQFRVSQRKGDNHSFMILFSIYFLEHALKLLSYVETQASWPHLDLNTWTIIRDTIHVPIWKWGNSLIMKPFKSLDRVRAWILFED